MIFDELIAVARAEVGIREGQYTPEALERAVLNVTGDADLAGLMRARAELNEMRAKGQ